MGITLNSNKNMLWSKPQILTQPARYMKRGKTKSIKIAKYIIGEDNPESAMKIPLKIFKVAAKIIPKSFQPTNKWRHS